MCSLREAIRSFQREKIKKESGAELTKAAQYQPFVRIYWDIVPSDKRAYGI